MKTLKTLTFGVLNKGAQDPALARRACNLVITFVARTISADRSFLGR